MKGKGKANTGAAAEPRFLYRNVEELLAAIDEGRACNDQLHARWLAELEPGKSTQCPLCRKPLSAAPAWKCVHGSFRPACEICRDTLEPFEAEALRNQLRKERERL